MIGQNALGARKCWHVGSTSRGLVQLWLGAALAWVQLWNVNDHVSTATPHAARAVILVVVQKLAGLTDFRSRAGSLSRRRIHSSNAMLPQMLAIASAEWMGWSLTSPIARPRASVPFSSHPTLAFCFAGKHYDVTYQSQHVYYVFL